MASIKNILVVSHGTELPGDIQLPNNVAVVMSCEQENICASNGQMAEKWAQWVSPGYNVHSPSPEFTQFMSQHLPEFCAFTHKCPDLWIQDDNEAFRTGVFELPASLRVEKYFIGCVTSGDFEKRGPRAKVFLTPAPPGQPQIPFSVYNPTLGKHELTSMFKEDIFTHLTPDSATPLTKLSDLVQYISTRFPFRFVLLTVFACRSLLNEGSTKSNMYGQKPLNECIQELHDKYQSWSTNKRGGRRGGKRLLNPA